MANREPIANASLQAHQRLVRFHHRIFSVPARPGPLDTSRETSYERAPTLPKFVKDADFAGANLPVSAMRGVSENRAEGKRTAQTALIGRGLFMRLWSPILSAQLRLKHGQHFVEETSGFRGGGYGGIEIYECGQ